jgi:amidase
MTDAAWLDATAQSNLVNSGEASPAELVDEAIARIEAVNPHLNAVIHERFDKARAEAAGDLPHGPFRGVPLVVKDLGLTTEGDPYHVGMRALRDAGYVADHDSELAARFRRAGFVVVGRTNTPELGMTITTEPLAHGASHNPWNLDHSTGGSSGGSAAAVAAGLTAVGHANDGGGSIRIPAANCGLVGLKPTRGRVSQGPDHGETWAGATIDHAVTRTVRDSAAILDAIAGPAPGDPYTAPTPSRPFAEEVGVDPGSLRIGVLDHPPSPDVAADPICAEAVHAAARLLEGLGHKVEAAWPQAMGEQEFSFHFATIVATDFAADVEELAALIGKGIDSEQLEPGNQAYPAIAAGTTAVQYVQARRWIDSWHRRTEAWWSDAGGDYDLLVSPVLNGPPPPLGWLSDPDEGMTRLLTLMQYTAQWNMTGQPAISLPLHWSPDGLPIGVQFVAATGREDLLIRLASQLEQAQPWADRHPPTHA